MITTTKTQVVTVNEDGSVSASSVSCGSLMSWYRWMLYILPITALIIPIIFLSVAANSFYNNGHHVDHTYCSDPATPSTCTTVPCGATPPLISCLGDLSPEHNYYLTAFIFLSWQLLIILFSYAYFLQQELSDPSLECQGMSPTFTDMIQASNILCLLCGCISAIFCIVQAALQFSRYSFHNTAAVLTFVFATIYQAVHAILCFLLWYGDTHPSYRGYRGILQIGFSLGTCTMAIVGLARWDHSDEGIWEYLAALSPALFFLSFSVKFWYSPALNALASGKLSCYP